jgi:hypothetical protein
MTYIMTTFKLSAPIYQKLLNQIMQDDYGVKSRSRWIKEAVELLLSKPNYAELVLIAADIKNLNKLLSIRMSTSLAIKLADSIIEIRKIYPNLEGVKSNIFRASIVQRLLLNVTNNL